MKNLKKQGEERRLGESLIISQDSTVTYGSKKDEGERRGRTSREQPALLVSRGRNPPPDPGRGHTKGHCHPRASSAKTRGFHTQLDEGPEAP